jgi:hypothetical protein
MIPISPKSPHIKQELCNNQPNTQDHTMITTCSDIDPQCNLRSLWLKMAINSLQITHSSIDLEFPKKKYLKLCNMTKSRKLRTELNNLNYNLILSKLTDYTKVLEILMKIYIWSNSTLLQFVTNKNTWFLIRNLCKKIAMSSIWSMARCSLDSSTLSTSLMTLIWNITISSCITIKEERASMRIESFSSSVLIFKHQ